MLVPKSEIEEAIKIIEPLIEQSRDADARVLLMRMKGLLVAYLKKGKKNNRIHPIRAQRNGGR